MGGNESSPPLVVDASLLSSMDAADGERVGLVEVSHRAIVLALVHLHNEPEVWPVGVDGEGPGTSRRPWVPAEPVEPVLPESLAPEERVDPIEDVPGLVVGAAPSQRPAPRPQPAAVRMRFLCPPSR